MYKSSTPDHFVDYKRPTISYASTNTDKYHIRNYATMSTHAYADWMAFIRNLMVKICLHLVITMFGLKTGTALYCSYNKTYFAVTKYM